jgi:dTDP-4-dehydrorhamnose reductase
MNILITGAYGQLGQELKQRTSETENDHDSFFFTDKETLDITLPEHLITFIERHRIDTIVNCAAFTDVDGAESNPEAAWLINDRAVENLARMAVNYNLRLIHVSTDYVFDGTHYKPYQESDQPSPQGVYGQSKWAGEQKIIENKAGMIIRTAWLYSPYGKNFVKTIARLVTEKDALRVVYDQIGNPTHAGDLADAILHILEATRNQKMLEGVYHFANEGVCSWYDFAMEIARLRGSSCAIEPIESKDYPTPAPRPHYSVFNKQKIKEHFNLSIPWWRDSLSLMLKEQLPG